MTARTRTGRIGARVRVRWSIAALRCLRRFLNDTSEIRTGEGATKRPKRTGSSMPHWAMSA
ncbi:MAG: hypothetical protein M0Z42_20495 [Actinomycetota bacterium]|nr:hypothetical protein [Actinomycetota bacterium]